MKAAIFLLSDVLEGVGGAEKRFFGLWINLQKRGFDCFFVTYQKMFDLIIETDEFEDYKCFEDKIIIVPKPSGGLLEKSQTVDKFVRRNFSEDTVLHFVMYYPILNSFSHPTVISDPASSLKAFNLKGKIAAYAGILAANAVDILDPQRARLLQKCLFWKRKKIKTTSNTFVDLTKYYSLPVDQKRNWFVFLGRFEPIKQVVEFVRAIPTVHQAAKQMNMPDCKFFILGHGSLESNLKRILKQPEYSEIDVELKYESAPSEILSKAKIFFSLQKYTNYPSKSLAEALASGCLPLVTDNGTTRLMAKPEFSFYVPENFDDKILAAKVAAIFKLSADEMQVKSTLATEFAKNELSLDKMTDYYLSLYQMLSHKKPKKLI